MTTFRCVYIALIIIFVESCRAEVVGILEEQQQQQEVCSICGEGKEVGNGDAILLYPGQPEIRCDFLQLAGQSGIISISQCNILPSIVTDQCDCIPLPPTTSPTEIPSQSPTALPTYLPSQTPTIQNGSYFSGRNIGGNNNKMGSFEKEARGGKTQQILIVNDIRLAEDFPTITPTTNPSDSTTQPSFSPSSSITIPTYYPTDTLQPTPSPSMNLPPTFHPTDTSKPSPSPSTASPTAIPTLGPSITFFPTKTATLSPTASPAPSPGPSSAAPIITNSPTNAPSTAPSGMTPTSFPTTTQQPSPAPSATPTRTFSPTITASEIPSYKTSEFPSSFPTITPSDLPTTEPTTAAPVPFPTSVPSPSPSSNPSIGCIVCTDVGTEYMQNIGTTCIVETTLIQRRCNKNNLWIQRKYCQKTCYFAGRGYDGDICCP